MEDNLDQVFIDELRDIYDAEQQIVETIPGLIKEVYSKDLKIGFKKHLLETKGQVQRLKRVFSLLGIPAKGKRCKGMSGLISECKDVIREYSKSEVRDAAIIAKAQRVEHYEIAVYGTLLVLAKELSCDKEICSLLKESLHEEGQADKNLTKVAAGGFFSRGINAKAERKAA